MSLIKGLGPGGAEMLLVSSARVANHDRYEHHVVYLLPWKDAHAERLRELGVRVTSMDARRRLEPRWMRRFRRLLLAERPDILHLHSPLIAGVARIIVRTLPRGQRPRLISTEHNSWQSYSTGTRWMNALLYRHDDARLAVSEDVRRSIWRRSREGVEVVVHGLVLDDIERVAGTRDATRAQLGVDQGEVLICTVANFRSEKAYPDLLRAARLALNSGLPLVFAAVGQGPLEAEIRAMHAELELEDRFRLLGYREDVLAVLTASDIFALASRFEGFPIAVMEALVAGVPLAVTSVGGIRDSVTDGVEGRVVPAGYPEQLAAAIVELASNSDMRAQMAANARIQGQKFDIALAVRRIERIYDRLVEDR
jgi:glycosyltransferase involved in cell wall biosynthesis